MRYSLILRSHLYVQGVLVYIEPDYTIISISSLISLDTGCPGIHRTIYTILSHSSLISLDSGCPGIHRTRLYDFLSFSAHVSSLLWIQNPIEQIRGVLVYKEPNLSDLYDLVCYTGLGSSLKLVNSSVKNYIYICLKNSGHRIPILLARFRYGD